MTRPPPLPDAERLIEVCEATWPPAGRRHLGAWTIRDGQGGGQRVSAATEDWPVTEADLPAAEAAMRALGQVPLFRIRAGEDKLDALLARHGYDLRDPVNIYAMPVADLLGGEIPPGTAYAMWPPLELALEIWADGGIGEGRLAVMDRAPEPKAAILVRIGDGPGGVGFVGIHDGIAMLHAIHVLPEQRRKGAATLILRKAARWAAENGADVISLIVTQGNHAANPLYVSLGMRLVGHYHYRRLAEGN
ncbi:GNAT family N-acetyltransferase [Maritimibacter fusiformis]|uniref:N-acetyltransferase n=1 Tax=Maritimibacter fusiformis TaxID=2603819 RepID=A0A5D0RMU4_9RHOB|nr:GNAT family N-acetyltransferase [Maritimibacter fusiformis]TYB82001.1 N-acetyltransferase [Maritimibacter fusiformis]